MDVRFVRRHVVTFEVSFGNNVSNLVLKGKRNLML